MSEVFIDIDVFQSLVNELGHTHQVTSSVVQQLRNKLIQAGTSVPGLEQWRDDGMNGYEFHEILVWCTRALELARLTAASDPTFAATRHVVIDDSQISDLTDLAAISAGRDIGIRMAGGSMTEQDWDTIVKYQNDPYFSAGLINNCPPAKLASIASGLSSMIGLPPPDSNDPAAWFPVQYGQRLAALGSALGAATWSGLLRGGYIDDVMDVLKGTGSGPAAMGAVLSYANCRTDFALSLAEQVYDYETGDDFPGSWKKAAQGTAFILPGGGLSTDVMAEVMTMLSRNDDAARSFFTRGGTAAITMNGVPENVNARLEYLVTQRTWSFDSLSDEGAGLSLALKAAGTAVPGSLNRDASAQVVDQLLDVIWAGEHDNPGWHISIGMRDIIGRIIQTYRDGSTPGDPAYPGFGLGGMTDGTGAAAPQPPPWAPDSDSPDPWGSQKPTQDDADWRAWLQRFAEGADTLGYDDAAANLRHYLDRSGTDKEQNVDTLLTDLPSFADLVNYQQTSIGSQAINTARSSGVTGPVSFPVNTAWLDYHIGGTDPRNPPVESTDLYYATNQFNWNLNGTVTVLPPDQDHTQWRYEMDTTVNTRDRYNFNPGMAAMVAGYLAPDADSAHMAATGMARGYDLIGQSTPHHSEGTG